MSQNESFILEQMLESDGSLVDEIALRYDEWSSAKKGAVNRWKETKQFLYATSTRETVNANAGGEDGRGWSHSTHIPKLAQIYDNLVANYRFALFPRRDWFSFIGEDREAATLEKRSVAESYLRTKHDTSGFNATALRLLEDWTLYGNCFCQVTYEFDRYETELGEQMVKYQGPVVNRISPNDIVFNPAASSFEDTPKIIRTLYNLGEFMRTFEDNPGIEWDKETVGKVLELRQTTAGMKAEDIDKYAQLSLDGFGTFSNYLRSGNVEVLTLYGDIFDMDSGQLLRNHKVTIVDRKWLLSKEQINTWAGHAHIYHAGWRNRVDNLWAMGVLDNLLGMQYQINHLENSKADALDRMIFPTRVVVGDVDEDGIHPGKPGGTYRIPAGEGSVSNLAPDTTILGTDFAVQFKMQLMEELAGAPREALGVRTPGEKTAFEVGQLSNAASRNFQSKIDHFENTFIVKVLNAELELGRQFLDGTDIVKKVSEQTGASTFLDITKEDLNITGKLVPTGASHFTRQNQIIQNITQLQQLIATDPMVSTHFPSKRLAKMYEELLGIESFDLYQEFGRVEEETELAQLQAAAQEDIQGLQAVGEEEALEAQEAPQEAVVEEG